MLVGIDLDQAMAASLAVILGVLALGLLGAVLLRGLVVRVISVVVMVAVVAAVWTQRDELQTCADDVQAGLTTPGSAPPTCTLFGFDVTVPLPTPDSTVP